MQECAIRKHKGVGEKAQIREEGGQLQGAWIDKLKGGEAGLLFMQRIIMMIPIRWQGEAASVTKTASDTKPWVFFLSCQTLCSIFIFFFYSQINSWDVSQVRHDLIWVLFCLCCQLTNQLYIWINLQFALFIRYEDTIIWPRPLSSNSVKGRFTPKSKISIFSLICSALDPFAWFWCELSSFGDMSAPSRRVLYRNNDPVIQDLL